MLISNSTNLTPEERRALSLAALTTIVTSVIGASVSWAFEEAKRFVAARRERKPDVPVVTLR